MEPKNTYGGKYNMSFELIILLDFLYNHYILFKECWKLLLLK